MNTTVSTKYQVVIPKAVRKQLGIHPGQKLHVEANKDGSIRITRDETPQSTSVIRKYAGSLHNVWGGEDPAGWLRKDRDASDR